MSLEGPGFQEAPAARFYQAPLCEIQVVHIFPALLSSLASLDCLYHLRDGVEVLTKLFEKIMGWALVRLRVWVLHLGDEAKGFGNLNSRPKPYCDGFWLQ